MHRTITVALGALALTVGVSATSLPAAAQSVTITTPGIAFGYSDGYWDQSHHWHAWRNAQQAAAWRAEHRAHFYNWRHDRDHDMGWRTQDAWWHH